MPKRVASLLRLSLGPQDNSVNTRAGFPRRKVWTDPRNNLYLPHRLFLTGLQGESPTRCGRAPGNVTVPRWFLWAWTADRRPHFDVEPLTAVGLLAKRLANPKVGRR